MHFLACFDANALVAIDDDDDLRDFIHVGLLVQAAAGGVWQHHWLARLRGGSNIWYSNGMSGGPFLHRLPQSIPGALVAREAETEYRVEKLAAKAGRQ